MTEFRFGTLGAANITPQALLAPASRNDDVSVVAIAARDRSRAEAMAERGHIEHVVDDYQAVIDHPDVNAIYNPLPISHHREWTLKALAAGKPVLCEKSFSMNEAEAVEMAEAADRADLLLIEAFHYRYHPVFLRTLEIYRGPAVIGDLVRISPVFSTSVSATSEMPAGEHPHDLRDRWRRDHGHGLLSHVLGPASDRRGARGRVRRGRGRAAQRGLEPGDRAQVSKRGDG